MRIAAVITVALALLVCANAKKPKDPKDWTGHKISEVVDSQGAPSTVYDDAETKLKVYVWTSAKIWQGQGTAHTINYGSGVQHTVVNPGAMGIKSRYKMFWVDSDGMITKWKQGRSSKK